MFNASDYEFRRLLIPRGHRKPEWMQLQAEIRTFNLFAFGLRQAL